MNRWFISWLAIGAVVCGCFQSRALGAMYNYQSYDGNGAGAPLGTGTLSMSNGLSYVDGNFIKGPGTFSDMLVIYIDSVPGGFTDTSGFHDSGNAFETAISGTSGANKSTAFFAPGFAADYAIAMGIGKGASVYKLVTDGTGTHLQLVQANLLFPNRDNGNYPNYPFEFFWGNIGLTNRYTNFFKFESTYISDRGSLSLQSFEDLTGSGGYNSVTFTNYDTYGVPPVPENTNAALAVFGGLSCAVVIGNRLRRVIQRGETQRPHT